MSKLLLPAALVLLAALAAPVMAGPAVGGVSRIEGSGTGEIEGKEEALAAASTIFLDEIVSTAAAARVEITFEDTTLLTLGENASVTIDSFVYDPGKASSVTFVVTGAMRFVSAAARPEGAEISFVTPVATIGVRGTDFWFGPIDGAFGVLLVDGAVVVSNPQGEAVLDEPGEGTMIADPGSPPGPVVQWPQQKVDRALAAVAFQ